MLREFLNPRHWAPSANREFFFTFEQARGAGGVSGGRASGRVLSRRAGRQGNRHPVPPWAHILTPASLLAASTPVQISQLCDQAERIFQQEPSVLKLGGALGVPRARSAAVVI